MPMTRRRVLLVLFFLALAAAVVSLTVGRDLYAQRTPDLQSFILVHFARYLFFIVLPVEVLVPWYVHEGHPGWEIALLAVVTALAAQAIDYGIGRLVSDEVVGGLIGERRLAKARSTIDRWGTWAILLFNLTPLSSPSMLAAAGVVRFGALRSLALSAVGLSVKYVMLAWLFV